MREIRFRAWDPKSKRMFVPFELKQKLNQRLGTFDDDIILLQYTGLKDKNRIEIYEGDIVKYSAFNEQKELQNYINPIFWEQNFASFSVGNEHSFWALSTCEDVEVIGNIYENPELLKK